MEKLWGICNNNFIGNDANFLTEAPVFIIENIDMLSYGQLQQIIEYINKIDKNQSTQEYIDLFIESHKSKFTENDIKYFLSQTMEERIITDLNKIQEQILEKKSLQSTLYKIIKSSGWNPEDEEFLDLHSEDEIYQWLKTETDTELLQIIRQALRIFQATSGDTKRESFGRKLYRSLLKIWREGDTIDELRITDYLNIEIPVEEKKAD